MLREKSGKLYQLVNLFGICIFPTLVVYGASIPLFIYAYIPANELSILDLIGSVIILLGTSLEFVSDRQMKRFIKIRA